jgi:hypothetical protein
MNILSTIAHGHLSPSDIGDLNERYGLFSSKNVQAAERMYPDNPVWKLLAQHPTFANVGLRGGLDFLSLSPADIVKLPGNVARMSPSVARAMDHVSEATKAHPLYKSVVQPALDGAERAATPYAIIRQISRKRGANPVEAENIERAYHRARQDAEVKARTISADVFSDTNAEQRAEIKRVANGSTRNPVVPDPVPPYKVEAYRRTLGSNNRNIIGENVAGGWNRGPTIEERAEIMREHLGGKPQDVYKEGDIHNAPVVDVEGEFVKHLTDVYRSQAFDSTLRDLMNMEADSPLAKQLDESGKPLQEQRNRMSPNIAKQAAYEDVAQQLTDATEIRVTADDVKRMMRVDPNALEAALMKARQAKALIPDEVGISEGPVSEAAAVAKQKARESLPD